MFGILSEHAKNQHCDQVSINVQSCSSEKTDGQFRDFNGSLKPQPLSIAANAALAEARIDTIHHECK